MELNSVEIGKRIKMIRCKRRLSQIAFAAELHVSREQILITGQEKDYPEKKMVSAILGDLLELDRRIDRVIELVTESGIV